LFRSGTVEQVEQTTMDRGPLIIAHRGASAHAPENTLAALQLAVDAGAEGVEFDVRLARDGVPVVIHDETLARTALRPERVSDLTSDRLNQIDVGSWFNTKYPNKISTTTLSSWKNKRLIPMPNKILIRFTGEA